MVSARMLRNYTSPPSPFCVIESPFHVFTQSVVKNDYKWRENIVSVTSGVTDIKEAASNTYKCTLIHSAKCVSRDSSVMPAPIDLKFSVCVPYTIAQPSRGFAKKYIRHLHNDILLT